MLKKSIVAMCLYGATWAGSCQAGFLNNQDLQFLWDINHTGDSVATSTDSKMSADNSQNPSSVHSLVSALPDNGVEITVPLPEPETIISSLTVTEPVSESRTIPSLNAVSIAVLAASVPEPGTFYLLALGLTVIGMTIYKRQRRLPYESL
jgi:hypothetical protein